jgi:diaminobutyrate-2-oxoglutarate transaminase
MTSSPHAVLERQRDRQSAARPYARTLPIVPVRAEEMTLIVAAAERTA